MSEQVRLLYIYDHRMAIDGNGGGAAPVQKRGGAGSLLQKLAVLLAMTVSLMASPMSAQIGKLC